MPAITEELFNIYKGRQTTIYNKKIKKLLDTLPESKEDYNETKNTLEEQRKEEQRQITLLRKNRRRLADDLKIQNELLINSKVEHKKNLTSQIKDIKKNIRINNKIDKYNKLLNEELIIEYKINSLVASRPYNTYTEYSYDINDTRGADTDIYEDRSDFFREGYNTSILDSEKNAIPGYINITEDALQEDSAITVIPGLLDIYSNIYIRLVKVNEITKNIKKYISKYNLNNETQYFLKSVKSTDSIEKHCFFNPIYEKFYLSYSMSKSDTYKIKMKTYLNKIIKYIELYKDGVKDNKEILQKIANALHISLIIYNINKKIKHSVSSEKKIRFHFNFIMSRYNHVEDNDKPIIIVDNQDDMQIALKYSMSNKDDFIKINIFNGIYKRIENTKTVYEINDDGKNLNKINYDALKITFIDNKSEANISTFIRRASYLTTTTLFKPLDDENLRGIDMKTNYLHFKNSNYYKQFKMTSKITDFYNVENTFFYDNLDKYTGFIEIDGFKINTKAYTNMHKILLKTKILSLKNAVIPTFFGYFLKQQDIIFNIKKIAFSAVPYDITERDEFMDNLETKITFGEKTIKNYCHLFGSLNKFNEISQLNYTLYTLPEDDQVKFLNELVDDNISISETEPDGDYRCYEVNKYSKTSFYRGSVANFVYFYALIGVLEQADLIPYDKIYAIQTDGIIFKECNIKLINNFRYKNYNDISLGFYNKEILAQTYHGELATIKYAPHYNNNINIYKNNFSKGAGGSGKTYNTIKNAASNNILFLSPSHLLREDVQKSYPGIDTQTIQAITNTDEDGNLTSIFMKSNEYEVKQKYSTIIVDECSMLTNNVKKIILELFKYQKIHFLGDIDIINDKPILFQMKPVNNEGDIFDITDLNIINYDKNFRIISDTEQLNIKLKNRFNYEITDDIVIEKRKLFLKHLDYIRDIISSDISVHQKKNKIIHYTRNNFNNIHIKDFEKYYQDDDILLSATLNAKCKNLNGMTNIDYFNKLLDDKKKKFVVKKEFEYNNIKYRTGQVIYFTNEKIEKNLQRQYVFSSHSVQGKTEKNNLIFINLDDAFEEQNIYVMLSRAVYFDQIFILCGGEIETNFILNDKKIKHTNIIDDDIIKRYAKKCRT